MKYLGNVLGKLLNQTYLDYEIPKGSGELNLPTFAAALFPSLFLKKIDQSYPEIKDKFLKNVIKSYMSELRYIRYFQHFFIIFFIIFMYSKTKTNKKKIRFYVKILFV